MANTNPLNENDMAPAVLAMFAGVGFSAFEQVPLGRKKIDLVFLCPDGEDAISVELKISDWKRALWQALVNFQISSESYIAIWHRYLQRAQKNINVFRAYGVGIIVVDESSATIVEPSMRKPKRIPPEEKAEWYGSLLVDFDNSGSKNAALPDVSAQCSTILSRPPR